MERKKWRNELSEIEVQRLRQQINFLIEFEKKIINPWHKDKKQYIIKLTALFFWGIVFGRLISIIIR